MYNLWLFCVRYRAFFFFVLFEVVSIALLINNDDYQRTSAINSSNRLIADVYEKVDKLQSYFLLQHVNDSLANENARLRGLLSTAYYDKSVKLLTESDTVIADSNKIRRYTYMSAKVINNTIGYRNNYLTLNKGSLGGVKTGMSVISDAGIVGIVKDVSDHFCTAVSFLHKDIRVSAMLEATGDKGSLLWGGGNPRQALMEDIPSHVAVTKGEKIITTGYSLFPEGLLVGYVADVPKASNDGLFMIDVDLSVDFYHLDYVYIVVDKFKEEIEKLEDGLKKTP